MITRTLALGSGILVATFLWGPQLMAQQHPNPILESCLASVDKKLLLTVLRANTSKELIRIHEDVALADRDVQRLYYTKLYDKGHTTVTTARHLLELMPQGDADSAQFYVYTALYDQHENATNWIGEKEARQASYLYNKYYGIVWELLPKYPTFLDRYLVMLCWTNADMSEAIQDWEPTLRKAFGKRYDEEKGRVWGVLDRPYDPPAAAAKAK